MRIFFLKLIILCYLYSDNIDISNSIKLEYDYFDNNLKTNNIKTLDYKNKIKYKSDNIRFIADLYLQKDFNDNKRSFASLNEAYLKYIFNNSFIIFGKEIKHWGVLEEYNIVDVFNINSNLINPFETNKIGNINFTYKYFFENDDSIEFITKIDETKDKYPSKDNPYYPFLNFNYDDDFDTQKNKNRPTLFIKYNGYLENIDYSLVYMNGYDNQRDLKLILLDTINQYLYLVNKYMGYATYQNDNILYKVEASYTDVKDYDAISDYLQFGIGTEYTKEINDFNLVYIAEYYKYRQQFNDNKKSINDLNIIFQNDLLLSLKLEFNNQNDSSLTFSLLNDLDYKKEKVIKTTFEQRLFNNYKIEFSYLKINPSKNNTYFKNIGKQDNIEFKIEYDF